MSLLSFLEHEPDYNLLSRDHDVLWIGLGLHVALRTISRRHIYMALSHPIIRLSWPTALLPVLCSTMPANRPSSGGGIDVICLFSQPWNVPTGAR
jgi:hypothetical protein